MGRLHRRPIFVYGTLRRQPPERIRPCAEALTRRGRLTAEGRLLAQGEGELDRHQNRDGLAESRAGLEPPLLGGFDSFLIEAECRVERSHDVDASNRSICKHNALEQNGALHFGAHRVCGVLRFDLAENPRVDYAAPGPDRKSTRLNSSHRQ